jgi:thymidine phosphorylase
VATADQISSLRLLIAQPDDIAPWDDVTLGVRIDESDSLEALAAVIWREKAASYAGLVDMKEGNSDRKLSQLHSQAFAMAVSFESASGVSARRPAKTRRIERQ